MVASCGGRAALEAVELAGGSESSTSTNDASSTAMTNTTMSAGGNGGNGGGGPMTATQQSSTNQTATTMTVGPPICDMTGDCQFCAECAQQGPCIGPLDACINNQLCIDFLSCLEPCMGSPGCFQMCAQANPDGAQLYLEAIQCIVCEQCPSDCNGAIPPQLCNL